MTSRLLKLFSQRLWLIPVLAVLLAGCPQNQQEQPSSPQTPTTSDQTETPSEAPTTPEQTETPTTSEQTETPTTSEQTETAQTRETTDRTSVTRRPNSVQSSRSPLKLETVYFYVDSARLTDTAKKQLRRVAQSMKNNPRLRIQIEGHTDQRGSEEYNLELGQRRAEAVKEFLIAQGVDPQMLSTLSLGKERPASRGSNSKAWAQNRRVEFIVLK